MKTNTIRNLIYKDFRISLHPSVFIFLILAPAMLFIPDYPRPIGFFYLLIGVMNMFTLDLQYKDREFCALLPARKRDCVKARILSVSIIELCVMLVSVPFAFIAHRAVSASGAAGHAGMHINATLYAIVLIGYGIFNLILIPGGYRKHFRVFARGFIGMAVFMLLTIGLENLVCRINNGTFFLNGTSTSEILLQLPFVAGAAVFYVLMNILTYQISVHEFEKADI